MVYLIMNVKSMRRMFSNVMDLVILLYITKISLCQ